MAKVKTSFFCQNCGTQFSKWQGQCTSCKEWNTIVEEVVQKAEKTTWKAIEGTSKRAAKPYKISEIPAHSEVRMDTQNQELNRVLGGGLVPGSLTLLGGGPGIGKSTLMLQVALRLHYKTLYVTGEESAQQIKLRAERITPEETNCFILTETKTQNKCAATNGLLHNVHALSQNGIGMDSTYYVYTKSVTRPCSNCTSIS